jgi:hypothetical protein
MEKRAINEIGDPAGWYLKGRDIVFRKENQQKK